MLDRKTRNNRKIESLRATGVSQRDTDGRARQ
jgi:hypothetical protein